jgi:hypothetical protein
LTLPGTIQLVQQYHKSRNLTGTDIAVHRFLPKELGVLLYSYLTYVKPLEDIFAKDLYNEPPSSFLFVRHGKRMTAENIRDSVSSSLSRHLGKKLEFSAYR